MPARAVLRPLSEYFPVRNTVTVHRSISLVFLKTTTRGVQKKDLHSPCQFEFFLSQRLFYFRSSGIVDEP